MKKVLAPVAKKDRNRQKWKQPLKLMRIVLTPAQTAPETNSKHAQNQNLCLPAKEEFIDTRGRKKG